MSEDALKTKAALDLLLLEKADLDVIDMSKTEVELLARVIVDVAVPDTLVGILNAAYQHGYIVGRGGP